MAGCQHMAVASLLLALACGDAPDAGGAGGGDAGPERPDAGEPIERCVASDPIPGCPVPVGGDVTLRFEASPTGPTCPGDLYAMTGWTLLVEEREQIATPDGVTTRLVTRKADDDCGLVVRVGTPEHALAIDGELELTSRWAGDAIAWLIRVDGALALVAMSSAAPDLLPAAPELEPLAGPVLCETQSADDPIQVALAPGCEGRHPDTLCCQLAGQTVRVLIARAFATPDGPVIDLVAGDVRWMRSP